MSAINLPKVPIIGNVAGIRDFEGDYSLGYAVRDTVQRHTIGRRFLTDVGSVYRYAGAGGTLNTSLLAHTLAGQHMAYAAIAVAGSIGDRSVKVTWGAADGPGADAGLDEDEMQNGSVILWPTPTSICMNRIIEHHNSMSATGTLTLDLDFPIDIALTTASSKAEAMASPYLSVSTTVATTPNRGRVGLPMASAVSGEWCWLQTWGPCWVTPANNFGNADPCSSAGNTQVVARSIDGSIQDHDSDTTESEYSQHVGFQLSRAYAGGQGAPFIMLQISP